MPRSRNSAAFSPLVDAACLSRVSASDSTVFTSVISFSLLTESARLGEVFVMVGSSVTGGSSIVNMSTRLFASICVGAAKLQALALRALRWIKASVIVRQCAYAFHPVVSKCRA